MVEAYRLDDADYVLVTLGSAAGLVRGVVDALRATGMRAGMLKIRYMRPFPADQVADALTRCRAAAVLEKDISFGAEGTVFTNVNSALQQAGVTTPTFNFIGGLGGDDISAQQIESIFYGLEDTMEGIDELPSVSFLGVDGEGR